MLFIRILLFQFVSNIEKSRSICGHVASPLSRICSGLDDSYPVVAPVWKSRGHPQTWSNIRPCWQYADLPPTRNVAHCGAFRCSRHIWCIQKLTLAFVIYLVTVVTSVYQRYISLLRGCPIGRFHPMVIEKERRGFPPLPLHCSTGTLLFSNINTSREGK